MLDALSTGDAVMCKIVVFLLNSQLEMLQTVLQAPAGGLPVSAPQRSGRGGSDIRPSGPGLFHHSQDRAALSPSAQ